TMLDLLEKHACRRIHLLGGVYVSQIRGSSASFAADQLVPRHAQLCSKPLCKTSSGIPLGRLIRGKHSQSFDQQLTRTAIINRRFASLPDVTAHCRTLFEGRADGVSCHESIKFALGITNAPANSGELGTTAVETALG